MAERHPHMGSTLRRESAPELKVAKPLMVDTASGTQRQPRPRCTSSAAALDGRELQTQLAKAVLCTMHTPSARAGAGTRHLSQLGSQDPSPALPASPPGTARQVEAPGSTV